VVDRRTQVSIGSDLSLPNGRDDTQKTVHKLERKNRMYCSRDWISESEDEGVWEAMKRSKVRNFGAEVIPCSTGRLADADTLVP
jgi:hypothetical protein